MKRSISSFSVLLAAVAMSIVGIASFRMLSIQYKPSEKVRSIDVSYTMPGASSRIVEAEVTSRIEGVLSTLAASTGINSVSRKGGGRVTVNFAEDTDMAAARFEVSSAVRNVYPNLPETVTYPVISLDAGGNKAIVAVTYTVKGDLPSERIEKYVKDALIPPLSTIEGVDRVEVSGRTPYHWVITFNANAVNSLGINVSDICTAFTSCFSDQVIGIAGTDDLQKMTVRLAVDGAQLSDADFGEMPVIRRDGHIVRLRDIATWRHEESQPSSYFRINGLNTVTLSVTLAPHANLLSTVSAVKDKMLELAESFPEEITVGVSYDASTYVSAELRMIFWRTGLCLLILLLLVFLVNRSWRHMVVMALTLTVNILVSIAIYALCGITVHIYTLAGITVSLSIVIDNSIVMVGHYAYWKDRGAFPDILAAVLTTVSALLLILLLPESERGNLTDFIWVIVINLTISLAVSYFFVPALMEYIPLQSEAYSASLRRKRRVIRWNIMYSSYIKWGVAHRWIYILAFVVVFGIPLFLLPEISDKPRGKFFEKVVRPVISWAPYRDNRADIDKFFGSTFGLFYRSLDRSNFYREPQKPVLHIVAGLPAGCSVAQLNEIVKPMENYLLSFDEVSVFTTSITSYDYAGIDVEFKPEYQDTGFPSMLKSQVTSMAINFGGANWRVFGVDDNYFDNFIDSGLKGTFITLSGYNFNELYRFAEGLCGRLSANARIISPEIWAGGVRAKPSEEYSLEYDFEKTIVSGVNPYRYYAVLKDRLYDSRIGSVVEDGELVEVVLKSSETDKFDLWHILNEETTVDSSRITLNDIGSITKRLTDIEIRKNNQSYRLDVCFDFSGSPALRDKYVKGVVKYMNEEVLPVGYKASLPDLGWFDEHKDRFAWLILLIIAAIYVMLAMTFESFKYPLPVISMIPVSFIGPFLLFGLSDYSFDQGGFAAFVMLCGIVVNAGIYLVNTWKKMRNRRGALQPGQMSRAYIKAYNNKIHPILLTVASTVLGLIPFLTDGPSEVFWFDFAAGTISGMLFSVLAMVFVLPVFLPFED